MVVPKRGRADVKGGSQQMGRLSHADQAQAGGRRGGRRGGVKAHTIVGHAGHQRLVVGYQLDLHDRRVVVFNRVGEGFLDDAVDGGSGAVWTALVAVQRRFAAF